MNSLTTRYMHGWFKNKETNAFILGLQDLKAAKNIKFIV